MSYPVVTTGIVLAPRGVGIMLAAMICGRLLKIVGPRVLLGLGLVIGCYVLYEMTSWTPDISQWTIVTVGIGQGFSIGFVAIPLNITAFATLPSDRRTEATSIYALTRNLGSSIGISVTGALLQTNTQVNHALTAEAVNPFNHALQSDPALQFWNPWTMQGAAMLNQEITRQAQIIAYVDDFKLMLILAVVTMPLVLLTRSSRRN
jgi:MFS transporter, DHA2 family, multidrug resistance protein